MPIGADHLAAYFNAAIGVTAFEFGVPLRRLSLEVKSGRRDRPQFGSLKEYISTNIGRFDCIDAALNYTTVLLSGGVGRVIGLEAYLAYPEPHLEMARLERAYLAEARLCREPETDRAMAIAIGWLRNYNGGNADATFAQLWHRADRLLRTPHHAQRVDRVVRDLKKERILAGDEISRILSS
jgi:hypothetical protein